eukprot:04762.XXX_58654_57411_1 [CDS] Oithona nana genome sequencing.
MTANDNKMGACDMCHKTRAKYRCPRCESVTCSLICCKAHKRLKGFCDGIRDKTKFVPMEKITSMELSSDLSILEDAARYTEGKIIEPLFKNGHAKTQFHKRKAFEALQRACWRRNKCRLLSLPSHFSRHADNTSRYGTREDTVYWRIQWCLPHHEKKVYIADKVSEKSRICDLVQNILLKSFADLKDLMSIYQSSDLKDLMILLKNESPNPEKGSQRFHELDLEKSLVWNMQEQTVIEHPIITIIHRSHANFFLEDNIELSDLFPQEEKTQEEVEEDEEENVLNFHIPSFDQEDKESKKSPAKKLKLSLVSYASSECDD